MRYLGRSGQGDRTATAVLREGNDVFCEVAAALNLPFSEVADVDWPRAHGVGVSGERVGGLAGLWQRVKRGCQHRPTGGGTPRKEGGLSARDMATPGQLPGSARTANG